MRQALAVITLACVVLLPGLARSDVVTLAPLKDNTLYEPIVQDGYADVSDGAGPTMFTGKTKDATNLAGQVAVRRAVIEFDIAGSLPPGATIDSVQLTLYADKVKLNTNFTVSLHRLLSEWGEGTSNTGNSQQGRGEPATTNDATWRHTFYPAQLWTTTGGDFATAASASRSVGATGSYVWGSTSGMVADVQTWLANPTQNHGWIVRGNESQNESAKRFATRENGTVNNRPKLVVQYTPISITGACCGGEMCSLTAPNACPGVYQGDGTSCTPNPCYVPIGACCTSGGTCSQDTRTTCESAGGTYQGDETLCSSIECPIVLTKFLDPLPIPPVAMPVAGSGSPGASATYDMAMRESKVSMHSELPQTTVWGYDDGTGAGYLSPIIEARSSQPVTVNWINDLREFDTQTLRTSHYLTVDTCVAHAVADARTVVHLHGGHVPPEVDGYPESTFPPGAPPVPYVYPNNQQAGNLWFHDHAIGMTRLNVYMGLAGLYYIRDSVEDALGLPAGEFELPLILQDRKFNPDGSFQYPAEWQDHFFGDKLLVNGKVWPHLDVKRGRYRLRLYNGSGSRVYTLSLSPPTGILTFTVIGNDLGLLAAPVNGVGQLTIGPGERYDVVINFGSLAAGDDVLLVNSAGAPFPNGPVDLGEVMKFRVTAPAGDTDPLPIALRPVDPIDPATAAVTRDFVLKRSGVDSCGRQSWMINGKGWDDDITEFPVLGTTEIWRFINDSGVSHPMHMHLVAFQVLDRERFSTGPGGEIVPNGNPHPPPAEERGWKDTAMVAPNEILRVIARFEDYEGTYPYHCHILEHEDNDMMGKFRVLPEPDRAWMLGTGIVFMAWMTCRRTKQRRASGWR